MELAKQLLIDTDMSAVEISEKCGYYDGVHIFQKSIYGNMPAYHLQNTERKNYNRPVLCFKAFLLQNALKIFG